MMDEIVKAELEKVAIVIADQVIPEYRAVGKSYPCHGHVAKRWQAAYDGALLALRAVAA